MNQLPDPQNTPPIPQQNTSISHHPEQSPPHTENLMEPVNYELDLPKELEAMGVQKTLERVDVPPDIAKMGVSAVGPNQPIQQVQSTIGPKLPISDSAILKGLRAKISSSARWLSEWCIYELKRAHIHLKIIAGKPVRRKF